MIEVTSLQRIPLVPGQTFALAEAQGNDVGSGKVESIRDGVVFASFVPGLGYAAIEPLFMEMVESANALLLERAGELSDEIETLGIHLVPMNGEAAPAIYDVQLFGDSLTLQLQQP